jgi:diguanylate cyclase (GGDEF)-like protein
MPNSSGHARADADAMGRVAGTLFLIGSVMTVMGILLPHSSKADIGGFWGIAAGTAVVGTLLVRNPRRLPARSYEWLMLLGSVTVTLSLYFNGERHGAPSAGNQVLYLWIALYCGYFFSRAAMILQLAAVAGLFGGVLLVIHPGSVGLTRWLITSGMVVAAAAIVHALRLRNDELVARLSTAARTDSLTGLLNRQGFDECLARELLRSRRVGRPVALVIADIDRFKEINDRCGHAAGDAALRVVGDTARRMARVTDTIARIGGDEFALVLPDTDADGAFSFAERMREDIMSSQNGGDASFTMSFGIAESEADGLTADILSRAADGALYEAKGLGRNQTVAGPGARQTVRRLGQRRRAIASSA